MVQKSALAVKGGQTRGGGASQVALRGQGVVVQMYKAGGRSAECPQAANGRVVLWLKTKVGKRKLTGSTGALQAEGG